MKAKLALLLCLLLAAACTPGKIDVTGKLCDPLDGELWKHSEWISAADAPVVKGKVSSGTRSADGASWFVSEVKNEKRVIGAKWMTAGLGVYELFLNGEVVGEEILKPGFTHFEKTKRSFTYDLAGAFRSKAGQTNRIEARLTPGWWADKIITPGGHDGMVGDKCAFRGVLELTYEDGTKGIFGTDTLSWKAGIAGPVVHASIFDGEEYDARLERFCTDGLSVPEKNHEFDGEILPTAGAEVYLRNDLSLRPVEAYVWSRVEGECEGEAGKVVKNRIYKSGETMIVKPGEHLVIDFGQNTSAVPYFVFKAAEGTVLTCLPAELLNDGNGAVSRGMDGPGGSIHRKNLRIADTGIRLSYTFGNGGKAVRYHPTCTFFGYRYISVTATDEVSIRSVCSIPVTSVSREMETGRIITGDESINRLISNAVWGMRSNYLSIPTDCPQRDERLGWTADAQVFAQTGTYFAATDRFFRKWMRDLRDSQSPQGAYPGVAPKAQYGDAMMRLGWADAGIIIPWTVWKQFGDVSIIEENWDSMLKFMTYVDETSYSHEYHASENQNGQWADWLSYEKVKTPGGDRTNLYKYWNFLSASYWMSDAAMMRDMASATGRDASVFEEMVERAGKYIKDNFLGSDGRFLVDDLNDMQTPALFVLKNGLLQGEARDNVISRLRDNFAKHGGCLQTGFLGTSILMPTLTDNGMTDVAYGLLFQRKNPSWLYSVDNGATTIWERWNSYTSESGMLATKMNSFNHYAYGSVCEWIWECAAGIACDTSAPGFRHIIMKPVPDKRLGFVKAEYNSAAGLIRSEWRYEGDTWIWQFTIPDGATASVTLPGEDTATEYSAGDYTISL